MPFSVVVCTYNYAHLLPYTLRTLAAQTVSDFELLVVDDGSSDRTEEVVAQFRPQFRTCQYLKKPHTGLADTRNCAIQAAQGTHIAFLDADDLWSPHYLNTIRQVFFENPQAGLVFCDGFTFRNDGAILEWSLLPSLPPQCGPIRSARDLFAFINAFSPSGMVFTKSVYDQVGPFDVRFDEGMGDDLDWIFRALMAGVFCVCLNQKLYLYRRHTSNLTNSPDRFLRAWLGVYARTLKASRTDPQIEALARGFTRWYSLRLLASCSTREGHVSLRGALETLGGDPILRLYYVATYFGLPSVLKLVKMAKGFGRRWFRERLKIDLSTPPEAIFEALPK